MGEICPACGEETGRDEAIAGLLEALEGLEAQRQFKPERLLSALHLWDAVRAALSAASGRAPTNKEE